MRNFLFRGKRTDNSKWIYGYYAFMQRHRGMFAQTVTEADFDAHYIVTVKGGSYEVDPSSVGQFTGLRDKYNRPIFDGDIIEFPDYGNGGNKIGNVEYSEEDTLYEIIYEETDCIPLGDSFRSSDIEVIGNIFDNSELLAVVE